MESADQLLAGTSPVAYSSAGCSACKAASLRLQLELLLCTFIFLSGNTLGAPALTPVHSEPKMKLIEATHKEDKRVRLHPGTHMSMYTHSRTCSSTQVYTHLHTHTHTHTDLFLTGLPIKTPRKSTPTPRIHVHLEDGRSPKRGSHKGKSGLAPSSAGKYT